MSKLILRPTLHPVNMDIMSASVASYNQLREGITASGRRQTMEEAISTPKGAAEFAKARKELVNISIAVDLIASELFELRPLGKDEHIVLQTTKKAEYQVTQVAQPGGMPKKNWENPDDVNAYYVYNIKSDTIIYPTLSIQQGNLALSDGVNTDLQFSYDNKIDVDAWAAFTAIFGAFPSGVYDLHSRINSSNLPTTNVISDAAEGSITLQVMKDVLDWMNLAGRTPRAIYCSPQDMKDQWDWVTVTSGLTGVGITDPKDTVPSYVKDQIYRSGKINNILGYDVFWRPLNFLASGTFYVSTNQPSGYLYFKPDLEDITYWNEEDTEKHFKEDYSEAVRMKGAIKPLIPSYLYMNSCKVIFSS